MTSVGARGCISAAHPLAVEAGIAVLNDGGNAVDAAIAVAYALGVVEPYGSGIGGGGVMLISQPTGKTNTVIDYRETAPWSATEVRGRTAVPGFVRGMEKAHDLFGSMPMKQILEPAINLASEGFPISPVLAQRLLDFPDGAPESCPSYFPNGVPLAAGDVLRQTELARTMESLAQEGAEWFYSGEPAAAISSAVDFLEMSDFTRYEAAVREPVITVYDDFSMITVPPPFGGVTLIQALKLSELLDIEQYPEPKPMFYHYWGQIMERCYTARTLTLGDPDFVDVPVDELISDGLIADWAAQIRKGEPQPTRVADGVEGTTHFVVADASGMCVSATNTIGGFFGTGLYVHGFFLNNQFRNFSDDVRSPNQFSPGKRPQSYACPTVLRSADETIAIGSAGGKRIPLTVATAITRLIKFKSDIAEAVAYPRFFVDDKVLQTEVPLDTTTTRELSDMGYDVQHNPDPMFYGGVHALAIDHNGQVFAGAADPRRGGAWAVANV